MNTQLLEKIEKNQLKKVPDIKPGDLIRVHQKIKEGKKERVQVFEGVVLRVKGGGLRRSFIVRKISFGVGVERSFLIHSPNIEKIEVKKRAKVRRAYLTYLRSLTGKKARLKDQQFDSLVVNVQEEKEEVLSSSETNNSDSDSDNQKIEQVSEKSLSDIDKDGEKDAELTELDVEKIGDNKIEEVPLSEVQKEETAQAEAEDEIKEGLDEDDHQKMEIESIEEGLEEAEKTLEKGKDKKADVSEKTPEDITPDDIVKEIEAEKK